MIFSKVDLSNACVRIAHTLRMVGFVVGCVAQPRTRLLGFH
ncbi:hypothetical protein [Neisseria montereyensis]|uniref:Uncharacterized protein n=1 Tax=Neisseria montereyensis TaxID=2973938 RepID=A0ABT2FC43_9NEIS|nr:hypothetical protein [Neisseria montereyensis]MCS4533088.1 hypothetical protein [Neisseria montereyensis]